MIPKDCKRLADVDVPATEVSQHSVREICIQEPIRALCTMRVTATGIHR